VLDSLDRGRQAFAQRAWKEAYARLSAADADTSLEGRDLEMMATAAYLIGNDEASETAWTRAYEWLRTRDKRRAARCAFWLVLQLLAIGDWASRRRVALNSGAVARRGRGVSGTWPVAGARRANACEAR
jgi:hypothetical protein